MAEYEWDFSGVSRAVSHCGGSAYDCVSGREPAAEKSAGGDVDKRQDEDLGEIGVKGHEDI